MAGRTRVRRTRPFAHQDEAGHLRHSRCNAVDDVRVCLRANEYAFSLENEPRVGRFSAQPRYRPVTIKEELSRGDLAFVEAHRGAANAQLMTDTLP